MGLRSGGTLAAEMRFQGPVLVSGTAAVLEGPSRRRPSPRTAEPHSARPGKSLNPLPGLLQGTSGALRGMREGPRWGHAGHREWEVFLSGLRSLPHAVHTVKTESFLVLFRENTASQS